MKQRISVRAIIRKDEKTLLLRRSSGRASIVGKYELPGGTIDDGEQPEDALSRHLKAEAGLLVQTAQLFDVFTYIDREDREVQHAIVVYLVSLASGGEKVTLSQNYNQYEWAKYDKARQLDLTEASDLLLGISNNKPVTTVGIDPEQINFSSEDKNTTANDHLIVYSDGGSRGNPGPSASGYVVMDQRGEVIYEGGEYLGITTNNQAEYHGVRLGLEKAAELGARTVDFRIDSLLVVNQMNGIYRIKNRELWPIHERIKELVAGFDKVTFSHVRREFNQLADGMVNKTLDNRGAGHEVATDHLL